MNIYPINQIDIIWDNKELRFIENHGSFEDIFYFKINNYYYPYQNARGFPAITLAWLLKELRLFQGKSPVICRTTYYYFQNLEKVNLFRMPMPQFVATFKKIIMTKKESNILHVKFEEQERTIHECYVRLEQFYQVTIKIALEVLSKYKNIYPQGGEIQSLNIEIERAKKYIEMGVL